MEFEYSDYEFNLRMKDAETIALHRRHLQVFVHHFQDCKHVLDVASGIGVFLDLLKECGIPATGVDADRKAVELGGSKGHHVIQSDVLAYLKNTTDRFDGAFCCHLIEHLPFDAVVELVHGIAKCLTPGGVLVIAFPNPRALRTHLHEFWMDPQHIRFYDSELIIGVLRSGGFKVVSDSNNAKSDIEKYWSSPTELMRDAQQVQRNTKGLATLQWLVAPEPTVGVGKFRSIVTHWLRARLGITTIADELVKLRRMVIEMANLIDAYDMEVRLIARKNWTNGS